MTRPSLQPTRDYFMLVKRIWGTEITNVPTIDALNAKQFAEIEGNEVIEFLNDDITTPIPPKNQRGRIPQLINPSANPPNYGPWVRKPKTVDGMSSAGVAVLLCVVLLFALKVMRSPQGTPIFAFNVRNVGIPVAVILVMLHFFEQYYIKAKQTTHIRLFEYVALGQWEYVLGTIPTVRRVADRADPVVASALLSFEAAALNKAGKHEQSQQCLDRILKIPDIPEWYAHYQIATAYSLLNIQDKRLHHAELAFALAPTHTAAVFHLASALAYNFPQRTGEAEALMDFVNQQPMTRLNQAAAQCIDGMIHLNQGEHGEAKQMGLLALEKFHSLGPEAPLIEFHGTNAHVLLCLACAALDEHNEARLHFEKALPMLKRHEFTDLIARCENAIKPPR